MEFISTKDMSDDNAPEGQVLVQYLEPSWGGWSVQFAIGYYDNPNEYEDPIDGEGWKLWSNERKINVIGYHELPEKSENSITKITQKEFLKIHSIESYPNKGNVGE